MALQALEIVRIGMLFPLFSFSYILAPHSTFGQTMRKPFIKFICHSASYFTFLCKFFLRSRGYFSNVEIYSNLIVVSSRPMTSIYPWANSSPDVGLTTYRDGGGRFLGRPSRGRRRDANETRSWTNTN